MFKITELFRSAAEAGPLDIVKLRKGDKLLNISPQLPANTPDTPYVLQVIIYYCIYHKLQLSSFIINKIYNPLNENEKSTKNKNKNKKLGDNKNRMT